MTERVVMAYRDGHAQDDIQSFCDRFEGWKLERVVPEERIVIFSRSVPRIEINSVDRDAETLAVLEQARAEVEREMAPVAMSARQLCAFAYTVAGAVSVPFMRDNPHYAMPSEEITAVITPLLQELGVDPAEIRGYYSGLSDDPLVD